MPEARIPVPHGPFVDPKTGVINRDWWRFLHDLWQRSGGEGNITGLFTTDIGDTVQAWDAGLDDLAGLIVTDGNIPVGDGSNWVAESGATFRITIGLVIGTDVFTQRTITAASTTPGAVGLSITNGNGVSGNPTIAITTSATDTIASGTPQTQAGATALTTRFNRVATHANTDDGVKLPSAVGGLQCVILNDTAIADLQVWPATDDAIEAASANAVGVTKIANAVATTYEAVDATTWYITNQHTTP